MKSKISEILTRSVSNVNIKKDLELKLNSGKQLRVKFGIDPTGFDLTLGHAVPLRKLKQFQDLGHQIILLIGNFTAQIGDPTGKDLTRKVLSKEDVANNAKDYLAQAGKILDTEKIEVVYNADWLEKLNFEEVLNLAGTFTVSQMLQREMFKNRMKEGKEINMVEFMYPLMQGYDSVPLKADVEIGGNDQLFNLMAGRVIQPKFGQVPQNIITTQILVGLDGKEKMSKSLWNYIALNDSAREMFGKTMSIPDEVILNYFELATEISIEEISKIKKELESGVNPRDVKIRLAKEIVTLYHSTEAANAAEQEFLNLFQKSGVPDNIEEKKVDLTLTNPVEIILTLGFVGSKGEGKRSIEGGALKINGKKIKSTGAEISLKPGMVIQLGKRKWAKIK